MIQPQFIKTPEGGELVVLSRADYDDLVERLREAEEDADDVAAYDQAKASPGYDRITPAPVIAFVEKGDSLLKAWRKHVGLTQAQLADKAGITQPYLSDLEARVRKGTPATMHALAVALGVDPEWLVSLAP